MDGTYMENQCFQDSKIACIQSASQACHPVRKTFHGPLQKEETWYYNSAKNVCMCEIGIFIALVAHF